MDAVFAINELRAAFTVLGLLSFVALTAWVYAAKRRSAFDDAARLPLDAYDEAPAPAADTKNQE